MYSSSPGHLLANEAWLEQDIEAMQHSATTVPMLLSASRLELSVENPSRTLAHKGLAKFKPPGIKERMASECSHRSCTKVVVKCEL